MEPQTNAEQNSVQIDSKDMGDQQQHERPVSLTVTAFDEDSYPIKSFSVYGKNPYLHIDLENVHFLFVKFIEAREVLTKYTDKELATLVTDMTPFSGGGVRLDFFKDLKLVRTRYQSQFTPPDCTEYYNVYNYDKAIASLCSAEDIFNHSSDEYSVSEISSSDDVTSETEYDT